MKKLLKAVGLALLFCAAGSLAIYTSSFFDLEPMNYFDFNAGIFIATIITKYLNN